MRNKEQEFVWQKVIEACMENVKHHFDDIQQAIEFGCYIQPDNYFVSYIFATDAQLETARRSGLTEQINSYHRGQLIKRHYPIEGIKDCTFASQEECDREFGGNWYYYFKGIEMIEYIKLFWEGAPEGEPLVILYEVDTGNERLALRSIDIFRDGCTRNIPDLYDGAIEITPVPTVEELNAHVWGEEFHACVIEKAEFEAIWESHTYDGALKESGGF